MAPAYYDSIITIPSTQVIPRDDHAAEDITNWMHMEKPTANYQERCYYHKFDKNDTTVSIEQPKLNTKLSSSFDASSLDGFVEWKMMGGIRPDSGNLHLYLSHK